MRIFHLTAVYVGLVRVYDFYLGRLTFGFGLALLLRIFILMLNE